MIRSRTALLLLLGLAGNFLAQPLLQLIGESPQFLVAHQLGRVEVGVLVGILITVPALVAWGIRQLCARLRPGWGDRPLALISFVLLLVGLVPPVGRGLGVTGWLQLAIALIAAAGIVFAVSRMKRLHAYLGLAGLAALGIAAAFFVQPGVQSLMTGPDPADLVLRTDLPAPADAPVVLVVFDALPVVSLQDESLGIDRSRYPSFARLADDGIWFPNALTISDNTLWAVPSILTGRFPRRGQSATAGWHPHNLFSWLEPTHDQHIFESHTQMASTEPTMSFGDRWALTASDLWILFLHAILPTGMTDALPPVTHDWRGFDAEERSTEGLPDRDFLFAEFLDSIERGDRAGFWFLHSLYPHTVYNRLPGGARYSESGDEPGGQGLQWGAWDDDDRAVLQSRQRHLLQLGYVDHVVGRIIDRLRQAGLYEDCLLVITADHGVSFRAGEYRRKFSPANAGDILKVPLLMKLPGGTEGGRVDDRNVWIVDILPTMAGVLGTRLPWKSPGTDVLANPRFAQDGARFFGKKAREDKELALDTVVASHRISLDQKLRDLGSGGGWGPARAPGGTSGVLGLVVEPDSMVPDGLVLTSPDEVSLAGDEEILPAEVRGLYQANQPLADDLWIAVTVDGVVQAVTRPLRNPVADGEWIWSALLPESSLGPGIHRIGAVLLGSGTHAGSVSPATVPD